MELRSERRVGRYGALALAVFAAGCQTPGAGGSSQPVDQVPEPTLRELLEGQSIVRGVGGAILSCTFLAAELYDYRFDGAGDADAKVAWTVEDDQLCTYDAAARDCYDLSMTEDGTVLTAPGADVASGYQVMPGDQCSTAGQT